MSVRGKSSLVAVAFVMAALVSAPVAGARQTCHDAGSVVRCETSGSVALKATPTARAPHVGQINGGRRGISWSW